MILKKFSGKDYIKVENLTVIYNENKQHEIKAIQNLSLTIDSGEFVCILGVSGCGKTTLLNTIAGFIRPTTGKVFLDGEEILSPGIDRGVVFQTDALFPWKTVIGNIAFGSKIRKLKDDKKKYKINTLIKKLGLENTEKLYPHQLSSGMAQRVEIARVLANDPKILLMDEPFSKLDAQTRIHTQQLLLDIWSEHKSTVLFVTHDIDEALFLADRVVILTNRPAQVKEEYIVNISRPRKIEMMLSDEFLHLKKKVFKTIEQEYIKAKF